MIIQVTAKNVGDGFSGTQCITVWPLKSPTQATMNYQCYWHHLQSNVKRHLINATVL